MVAGTRLPPSYCASFRAARMLAAINSTRLRPSSIADSVHPFAVYSPLDFREVIRRGWYERGVGSFLTFPHSHHARNRRAEKTRMKKQSKAPANWEVKRAKVVGSANFIKLFEKARKAMQDPARKKCAHGHAICATNAHVGDLKRIGLYSCDPCNRAAQARYAKRESAAK